MQTSLSSQTCRACHGGTPPLQAEEIPHLLVQIPGWRLSEDGQRLVRNWRVFDFLTGLEFFGRIGTLAEREDHHPDLHLVNYREATVELWTHTVKGLTQNDFIMAAKINTLDQPRLKD